ncbi:MAG: hypothetical protein HXX16_01965 [Bacteroidales bacterium]|nr:hypothetical protein [Bacteroidales bacterium]
MNHFNRKVDNFIPTIILFVLAFIFFAFALNKKESCLPIAYSSIYHCVDIQSNTQAVIPASIDLPIRAFFTDDNHIILGQSFTSNYSVNLQIDRRYNTVLEKYLTTKPLFKKVFRQLIFADSESDDFALSC